MSYLLGIDLGATAVTAALLPARGGGAEPFRPERGAAYAVPAVLVATPAGDLLCGEAARRRAPADPDRVARGFLARVGDPTPLSLGGVPYRAEDLCARLVRHLVDEVAAAHGAGPARIGLTHPVSWGRHKRDLLAGALDRYGLTVSLVAAPQAVALAHRTGAPGHRPLAVVDLGGHGSTATVLAPAAPGVLPSIIGPSAANHTGGADIDDAVFDFVRCATPAFDALDVDDPRVLAGLTVLRDECRSAKEMLSRDTVVTVPVELPGIRTAIRIHRSDLDELARPALEPVTGLVEEALAVAPDADVLLAGGAARMPMAVQLLSAELGRPLSVAADPVGDAARGAALAVAPGAGLIDLPGHSGSIRIPAPREPEPSRPRQTALRGERVPAAAVGLLEPPTGPLPPGGPHRGVPAPSGPSAGHAGATTPGSGRHRSAPAQPGAPRPERPAPDTVVTRDTGAPASPRTPARQRFLMGAGGVAGASLLVGVLMFWPTGQATFGELSAAPTLPSTSEPAPAPVVPPAAAPEADAPVGHVSRPADATVAARSSTSAPVSERAPAAGRTPAAGSGTTEPAAPGTAVPGGGTAAVPAPSTAPVPAPSSAPPVTSPAPPTSAAPPTSTPDSAPPPTPVEVPESSTTAPVSESATATPDATA